MIRFQRPRPLALRAQLTVITFIALAYMAVMAVRVLGANGGTEAAPNVGKCYKLATWNANPALRPCVRVSRIYEDGSFKFVVSDASGTPRYSGGVGAADR